MGNSKMQFSRPPKKYFWQKIPSGTWAAGALFGTVGIMAYFAIIEPFNNQEELRLRQAMLRSQIDPVYLKPQGNLPEWSSPYEPKR